jgi:hypothetical protein
MGSGVMCNVNISAACIRTDLDLPLLAAVDVEGERQRETLDPIATHPYAGT